MIACELVGGLGNQLFQIFAVISYAIGAKNSPVFLKKEKTVGMTFRTTYWNTFLVHLSNLLVKELPPMVPIKETSFEYNKLPLMDKPNIFLNGYFQSYKYFEEHRDDIFKMIHLSKQQETIRKNNDLMFENTISLHFRLGDYINIQDRHPILPISYYKNAIDFLLSKIDDSSQTQLVVLYFCEEQDLFEVKRLIMDLENFYKNFYKNITFKQASQSIQDWQQLLLMSCCKYNVIANSTFSWWAAYFNVSPDKIVCYPSQWFGSKLKHNTKDLFPPEWNCISTQPLRNQPLEKVEPNPPFIHL